MQLKIQRKPYKKGQKDSQKGFILRDEGSKLYSVVYIITCCLHICFTTFKGTWRYDGRGHTVTNKSSSETITNLSKISLGSIL